ncbi:response regulator transcription factor [candidate division KSB1 bacterium]|nr:response regulator transcription factor [candidate division KSB1 bacterium]
MAKTLNVVIIDDEAPAREVIKNYLKKYDYLRIKAECENGFEGIKAIQEFKPDIIFLDIQMPKITGFEMLELLQKKPVLVFSTAYDQYALKAFEVSAADYLLKPYSRERFDEAMNRALTLTNDKPANDKIVNGILKHQDENVDYLERIVVKTGSKISIIPVRKLFWLEAQDDYVMLHSKDGNFLKQKTMKYFESHLDPKEFVRAHRSYIVRISIIKQIELFGKESYRLILSNGQNLPVSRTGHVKLKAILS